MIKWMAILAWVCGLLGLSGTVYIFLEMYREKIKQEVNEEKSTIAIADTTHYTSATSTIKRPIATDTYSVHSDSGVELASVDTLRSPVPAKASNKKGADSIPPVVIKKEAKMPVGKPPTATAPEKTPKPADKTFTLPELKRLLNRIVVAKAKYKKTANCVQIFRTAKGNNMKASSQLEKYLKSHHFSISGRETIDNSFEGIKLAPKGDCIRVSLGML